jgi:hypothetical protein
MRCLPVLALLCAAACTTETTTDTGQLTGFEDRIFADCQDAGGTAYSCGLRVSVTDGQIQALGLFNNGATGGPSATGTLTEAAQVQLGDMIAQIPMETSGTVHDEGCGGAPLRTTSLDVLFDHNGTRHFDIEYTSDGPMAELHTYVNDLVTDIRTCSGGRVTFEACTANTP